MPLLFSHTSLSPFFVDTVNDVSTTITLEFLLLLALLPFVRFQADNSEIHFFNGHQLNCRRVEDFLELGYSMFVSIDSRVSCSSILTHQIHDKLHPKRDRKPSFDRLIVIEMTAVQKRNLKPVSIF